MAVQNPQGFSQWRGFERAPEGRLLLQRIDMRGAMGIAYERSVGYVKATHVHDRHMLICPRDASVMSVRTPTPFRVDAQHLLWIPALLPHDDLALTTVYDTFALFPSTAALTASAKRVGVSTATLAAPLLLRRSDWFSALLQRYFEARIVRSRRDTARLRFLELELLDELLTCVRGRDGDSSPSSLGKGAVAATLRLIEGNLFGRLALPELAASAGTSVATLLRHFRDETGTTPQKYIRDRRLDEAILLLQSGGVQVQEVALLVGYEELASFSKAFRKRFGTSPTAAREQRR